VEELAALPLDTEDTAVAGWGESMRFSRGNPEKPMGFNGSHGI